MTTIDQRELIHPDPHHIPELSRICYEREHFCDAAICANFTLTRGPYETPDGAWTPSYL